MKVGMNLRNGVWVLAVAFALGIGITGGAARAASSWLPQDESHDQARDQDYTKNKNYQLGMRDGQDDRAHNRDHSKKRHFKKDDDQRAYEAGYEQGHRGDQSDHHDNDQDRH